MKRELSTNSETGIITGEERTGQQWNGKRGGKARETRHRESCCTRRELL